MPEPFARDLETTRNLLQEWLGSRLSNATEVTISELIKPDGSGYSSDTLIFDFSYRDQGKTRSRKAVVRIEPDPAFVTRFRARRDRELGAGGSLLIWRRLAVRLLPLAAAALIVASAAVWLSMEEEGLMEVIPRLEKRTHYLATLANHHFDTKTLSCSSRQANPFGL